MMIIAATSILTEYRGNVCLQKAVNFIQHRNICSFQTQFPNNFLKEDDINCRTKCNVTINGFYNYIYFHYHLAQFTVALGDYSHPTQMCYYGRGKSLHMFINCSPWSQDEYMIWKREINNCQERNAYCIELGETCICQCWPEYLMVNGHCLEASVALGNRCISDRQCITAGSSYAVCNNGVCKCRHGFIIKHGICYPGNVSVGGNCAFDIQCYGSQNSGRCSSEKCVCASGYTLIQETCVEGGLALNRSCRFNAQCSHSLHALCLQGKCGCTEGYFAYNSTECLQDNVDVGEPCVNSAQCRGTAMSGVCENSTCICTKGYISEGQHCYEGNVSLGNACVFYDQCLGSPNASCLDGICNCIRGYVPIRTDNSSKCIQSFPDNEKEALFGKQRESNIGSNLGALFGGLLLGVLLTTVVGFIIYKRIRNNPNKRQIEEPRVVFTDNNTYGEAKIDSYGDNASRGNKSKRKVVNVPPYAPSDEMPEYSNVQKTSVARTEDIYNHLNDTEEQDDEDNYDHACAIPGRTKGILDSDYSSMRDVDKGSGNSAKNGADNYFTLEQN